MASGVCIPQDLFSQRVHATESLPQVNVAWADHEVTGDDVDAVLGFSRVIETLL
jgi:hypothetical protein